MCLAVPLRVVSIEGATAEVEMGGVTRRVSLVLVPETQVGDYVLVHTGFAISRLDEEEAEETLALFEEMAQAARAEEEEQPSEEVPDDLAGKGFGS
ncbi:MAG: HypC/HybG/HupF family hydrogenase formation chaperone [Chloroflexi bacterium]|nr:HypC/HybG/HupF family hydrogenase formation chaperone [Chloroflexota bacterium]